jgi:hypothetical protein
MIAQDLPPYKARDKVIFKIPGFRREVVLGYYAVNGDNSLRTFRDKLSVPSSRIKHKKGTFEGSRNKKGLFKVKNKKRILDPGRWDPITCPEMLVWNYHY